MIEFKIDYALVLRYVADQGIGTKRDAHAIARQVVGCDLLFQLQLNPRQKM